MASGAAGAVMGTFSPAKPRVKYPSAWDLPALNEAELRKANGGASIRDRPAAAKATCSGTMEEGESEEESEGSEYHMSGGLR